MVSVRCPACDHPAAPDAVRAGACARCGTTLAAMPAIDISQLTTLDDLGAPPHLADPRAPSTPPAPAPAARTGASAMPSSAFAPPREELDLLDPPPRSRHAFARPHAPAAPAGARSSGAVTALRAGSPGSGPSQAFAPPPEAGDDDQELGVERSTRAIRIANQFRDGSAVPSPAASPAAPSPAPAPSIRGSVIAFALVAVVAIGIFVALYLRS
jgi:hypothetical protein